MLDDVTIDYDARADILFVGRIERRVATIERPGYDVDLDENGKPCGVELPGARELLMGCTP